MLSKEEIKENKLYQVSFLLTLKFHTVVMAKRKDQIDKILKENYDSIYDEVHMSIKDNLENSKEDYSNVNKILLEDKDYSVKQITCLEDLDEKEWEKGCPFSLDDNGMISVEDFLDMKYGKNQNNEEQEKDEELKELKINLEEILNKIDKLMEKK